ncbi:MAG: major capsid protein [Microviridae sp.]|nr:MAG: major capsid protein [Microviridae sp.]
MNIFQNVQGNRPTKNKFDLSHERKMSLKMGTLTPFMVQEIVPGDSFKVNTEMLLRLQPMLAPIFHRVRVKTDYFFVPNRLVWDNWQKFITGGEDGLNNSIHPYFQIDPTTPPSLVAKGSLADYMGIPAIDPLTMTNTLKINALPFRAYQLIYDEYFRDENLITAVAPNKTDGQDLRIFDTMTMRKRAWEKDYFTSCLPWAQKGGAVNVPTTVEYKPTAQTSGFGLPAGNLTAAGGAGTTADIQVGGSDVSIENIEEIGITINDLRVSVRLQEWLERAARSGSRYIETILSNFGILSSDARIQRPEYLGGGVTPITISEVLSTFQFSGDPDGEPQGTMKGHGIAVGNYGGFKRKFEEHGFVFGIMTIIPRTAYQQGIPKMFSRPDKFDYLWPSFAQLGEQEVKNQELFFDPTDGVGVNEQPFGYQSRYAEYKYQASTTHGDFKDNLSFWTMTRIFPSKPSLNEQFITADPTKRIFAVEDPNTDEILCQVYNSISAIRPLPYFNTPNL